MAGVLEYAWVSNTGFCNVVSGDQRGKRSHERSRYSSS